MFVAFLQLMYLLYTLCCIIATPILKKNKNVIIRAKGGTYFGIPKKYIQEVGGWVDGNSSVLDRVYDNAMDSSRKKYTQIANRFIEQTFQEKKA